MNLSRRPLAAQDVLDVWDHIADDDMAAADRWLDELDTAFSRLATQPLMGRARPELAPDLRSFPFRRYVIFYIPLSNGIDVVRVLHAARDIDGDLLASGLWEQVRRGAARIAVVQGPSSAKSDRSPIYPKPDTPPQPSRRLAVHLVTLARSPSCRFVRFGGLSRSLDVAP